MTVLELVQIADYSLAKISSQINKWSAERTKEEIFECSVNSLVTNTRGEKKRKTVS